MVGPDTNITENHWFSLQLNHTKEKYKLMEEYVVL